MQYRLKFYLRHNRTHTHHQPRMPNAQSPRQIQFRATQNLTASVRVFITCYGKATGRRSWSCNSLLSSVLIFRTSADAHRRRSSVAYGAAKYLWRPCVSYGESESEFDSTISASFKRQRAWMSICPLTPTGGRWKGTELGLSAIPLSVFMWGAWQCGKNGNWVTRTDTSSLFHTITNFTDR